MTVNLISTFHHIIKISSVSTNISLGFHFCIHNTDMSVSIILAVESFI